MKNGGDGGDMEKKNSRVKMLFLSFWGFFWLGVSVFFWGGALSILCTLKIISKNSLQHHISVWARFLLWVSGMRVKVTGANNIDFSKNYIYMFNHQSMLDIPLTIGYIPQYFVMIAKKELFKIPIFGPLIALAGYIPINRSNSAKSMQAIKDAGKKIVEGKESVGIYPEGTRTRTGKMNNFKKGGFIMALEGKIPIVPVTINNTFKMIKPGKLIFDDVGELELIIHAPVEIAADSKVEDIMKEVRERIEGGLVS